jgi:hypothetical protein
MSVVGPETTSLYDQVPYTSLSYSESHPDRLATTAHALWDGSCSSSQVPGSGVGVCEWGQLDPDGLRAAGQSVLGH